MAGQQQHIVDVLLRRYGRTYAEQAGIRLADRPAPLFQLLVLSLLLSARISADIAVAAARELFAAGYRTPRAMRQASWQDRVDALGRGHYRRYDERTSTQLADAAQHLESRWNGDLRALRTEAGGDPAAVRRLLTEFPGIGPTGADIFVREVQAIWPGVAGRLDHKVSVGARKLSLPVSLPKLTRLAGSPDNLVRLEAALVRLSSGRGKELDEVVAAARS
jgi:endonuclease III